MYCDSHLTQLDLIVSSENGKASSTDILNSTDTMTSKKLKKSETEHLLTRLVQDNWLCEVKHCLSALVGLLNNLATPGFCELFRNVLNSLEQM